MGFIDQINVFVRAGHGGAGSRHFRRERFVPKGGPDGGDGGRGGHVILEGNENLSTLLDFRYQKHLLASNGQPGSANNRKGADGKDLVLYVPLGTIIKEKEHLKGEITMHGERCVIAYGGRGGLGNSHFKSATNQAPRYAQPGEKGEAYTLTLELKLIGDVGLVGAPNAGKSTLLSVISSARPKIGHYPFTTLIPNLGVVFHKPQQSFVVADIPGLIHGAAEGRGLGTRFLRHVERTKILLFMLAVDAEQDIIGSYTILQEELGKHNPDLLNKKHLIAITKIDLLSKDDLQKLIETIPKAWTYICLSSLTQKGINRLKHSLWHLLHPASSASAVS